MLQQVHGSLRGPSGVLSTNQIHKNCNIDIWDRDNGPGQTDQAWDFSPRPQEPDTDNANMCISIKGYVGAEMPVM